MATTPSTHTDLYTAVMIGGVFSPGTVKLSGFERKHSWEVQRPKGTTGEVTINHGPKNGGFTAEFYLADLEDVAAWDEFQRMLAASIEGPKPRALPAYHPDLVRNKIVDVVVESIGGFVHDANGGARVTCKFLEYRPPRPKPAAKPDAGKARKGANAGNRPDPNADAKRELQALIDQAKAP